MPERIAYVLQRHEAQCASLRHSLADLSDRLESCVLGFERFVRHLLALARNGFSFRRKHGYWRLGREHYSLLRCCTIHMDGPREGVLSR